MIPAREPSGLIRIASYNIRKCIGLDRRRTPERTLDVISKIDADIVALQEADLRLGRRPTAIPPGLLQAHTELHPVDLAANEVSLGWHGNALLVRRNIKVLRADRIELPSFEPRGAALAELDVAGQKLRIVGTHLGLMRRHRKRQLAHLLEVLHDLPPMPTLIMGDFNEWNNSRGLEVIEAQFALHAPGRTYHASRPVAPLDRFATSDEIRIHRAGVQKQGAARRASDHLPIWADIGISD